MARPGQDEDAWLEAIDLLPSGDELFGAADRRAGDEPDRAPARRHRAGRTRRLFAVAAAVAVAAALAFAAVFPVRTALAGRELHDLDVAWQHNVAVADGRDGAERQLNRTATTPDRATLEAASIALDGEALAQLAASRSRLHGMLLVDSGLRSARSAMLRWADVQRLAWRTHRDDLRAASVQARQVAESSLQHQRDRWHRRAVRTSGALPAFHSVDGARAALAKAFDERLGVTLMVIDDVGFTSVDVDASTHERRIPAGANINLAGRAPRSLVRRDGYLAFISQEAAYSAPPTATGRAVRLADATDVFAGLRPDAVWLLAAHINGHTTLTEVDGHGARLAGPFDVPGHPYAEVDGGLLLVQQPSGVLEVWDPATGRTVRTVAAGGDWVAATSDRAAWLAFDSHGVGRIHIVRLGGGSPIVVDPGDETQTGIASFSPDGRFLVTATLRTGAGESTDIAVVDVSTGAVQRLTADIGRAGIGGMAWNPAGDRLFVTTTASVPLFTWRIGDSGLRQLRVTAIHPQAIVVLAS